jgi:sugar (pentulose or hexulose) kinase
MQYLAIDIGTSFIKGAVLNTDSLHMGQVRRIAFPGAVKGQPALWHEVEPKAVYTAVETVLSGLADLAPNHAGVLVCSQMHSLVLVGAQGAPCSNAITWQDQRALQAGRAGEVNVFDQLVARIDHFRQALGNGLKPSLPVCTLYWLQQQGALEDGWIPSSLPDYIFSAWAGQRPLIEPTMAASQGAFDLVRGEWHQGALAALGLDRLEWPKLAPAHEAAYHIKLAGRDVPVYPAVGDHQCAVLGALLQERELSLNVSTGSQISLLAREWAEGGFENRLYFEGKYLRTVTRIPAGRALNVLVQLLVELSARDGHVIDDPWSHIISAVEETAPSDLAVDLSFFASAMGDQGSIHHMREENSSVGHLFRAAFGSMADNYMTCAARLVDEPAWDRLVFSGGVAQKLPLLRSMIAGRFAMQYRMCPTNEDTLLGLMALALRVSGQFSSLETSTGYIAGNYPMNPNSSYKS